MHGGQKWWTRDQAQNYHKVWWVVRRYETQRWWCDCRRGVSIARLYEAPHRDLIASAHNALHKESTALHQFSIVAQSGTQHAQSLQVV